METKNKKENLQLIIFSIVGAVISVLSFFLYHYCGHVLVTIMLCIADIVYAYFNARLFLKSKDWNGARQIFIPIMLLVYWTIIFALNSSISPPFFVLYHTFLTLSTLFVIFIKLLTLPQGK